MDEMNITRAQYVTDNDDNNICIQATIDGVDMVVPLDPKNRHYAGILHQVEAGTLTIEDAD